MTQRFSTPSALFTLCGLLTFIAPACIAEQPSPAAVSTFNSYVASIESRLAHQHQSPENQSPDHFLAFASRGPQLGSRLRHGDLIIEQLAPPAAAALPGALLHDWRGTAFIPGAKADDFDQLMRDFPAYPQHFSPQVLQTKILTRNGDEFRVLMRVRQRHVLTVVLDTTYDVTFGQLDPERGYTISRSTQISEIDSPGTAAEHALTPAQNHGYLWRLNTYWSYEQRDGGLYIQIESVSITRSIPTGLAWAVAPYIESIPRDSLEFTLRSTCNALHQQQQKTLP